MLLVVSRSGKGMKLKLRFGQARPITHLKVNTFALVGNNEEWINGALGSAPILVPDNEK